MAVHPRDAPFEGAAEIGLEAGICGIEQLTPRDDDNIDALRARQRGAQPENFSNQSFSPISPDGIAKLSRRHYSQAKRLQTVRGHDEREIAAADPDASLESPLELSPALHPPAFAKRLGAHFGAFLTGSDTGDGVDPKRRSGRHGQPLPALGAPALQNEPSFLARHADKKAVCALAAPAIRLEGTLHDGWIPCNERQMAEKPT